MSYTSFQTDLLSAPRVAILAADALEPYAAVASTRHSFRRDSALALQAGPVHVVKVRVTNSGGMGGATPVLGFISPPRPGLDGAPLRELVGFDKVYLDAGESAVVTLELTAHDLTRTARVGGRVIERGEWLLRVGETTTTLVVD